MLNIIFGKIYNDSAILRFRLVGISAKGYKVLRYCRNEVRFPKRSGGILFRPVFLSSVSLTFKD